ncbi:hypothetical protein [Bacterioplanoides sp.]|uniref:hypothetical protein n=1 Tax=Bacterioplanoides sp. TaxID=2066072 RepID=UPI003B5C6F13
MSEQGSSGSEQKNLFSGGGIEGLKDLILNLSPPSDSSNKPDNLTRQEYEDLELQEKAYQQAIKDNELASAKQRLKQRKKEHKQRVSYASKIFWLSLSWLAAVTAITVASGVRCLPFELSDTVLVTLLTTTTATVLGLFITVLRFLFQEPKDP